MYTHWLTRFLAFLLGVENKTLPVLSPEYVNKYLYPVVSESRLSELARDRWQG